MKLPSFSQLSKIEPEVKGSYEAIFLTIDIDWAHEEVINDTIDMVEVADVEATWFVTHQSEYLDRLRSNPKFELGIHPNFNSLLDGPSEPGDSARERIEQLLEVVPEARCLRSHSLFTSSRLLNLMAEYGLSHESNHYVPVQSYSNLNPHRIWNDIVRVPHSFADDVYVLDTEKAGGEGDLSNIKEDVSEHFVNASGLRVLDFHPIHVFLNTESHERYQQTRDIHQSPDKLVSHRYDGIGVRSALETLLGLP